MKMKYTVGVVMVVFSVFMVGVFGWGFIKKQQAESNIQNQPAQQSQSQNNTQSGGQNSGSPNTQPSLTAAEVAKHNSPKDCYLIIHNSVYNVTNFLDQHPGGTDVILPFCGKDATQAFETQGGRRSTHSQTARNLLAQYQVGTLQQ